MPFIPNYSDATYPDVAEPDSGDFEILLAGAKGDGVLSGCAVTASAAAFAPSDVSGMLAWYDFSQIATLWKDTARTSAVTTTGDAIKGVTDLSGAGNHLSEATNGPAYTTGIQNGLSVARFDGVDDQMNGVSALAARATATYFLVCGKRSAIGGNNGPVSFAGAVNSGLWSNVAIPTNWAYAKNGAGAGVDTGITGAVWHVICVKVVSSASLIIYGDGTQTASLDPDNNVTSSTDFYLGVLVGVNYCDVDFGAALIYDSALGDTDRNNVEAYLKTQWGTP